MLIAPDIAKRDAGDAPSRRALQIQRTAAPIEDHDQIAPGPDQPHRSIVYKQLVLIRAGTDIDLVTAAGILQCGTRERITARILCINDQRLAA